MNSKIKIMHIINSFSLAGAEKLVFDIALKIDKQKYEVYVCAIGSSTNKELEKKIKSELEDNSIRIFSIDKKPKNNRISTIFKLTKIIRENQMDIIHTHCPSPDFYGRIAARITRVKRVYTTIHNTAGYSRIFEKAIGKFTKGYIAISEQVKRYMVEDLNISEEKISLVPNGIDVQKYSASSIEIDSYKKSLGLQSKDIVITNIGRVTEQKGQIYLIRSIKKVKEKYSNIKVLIIGNKDLDKSLYNKLQTYVIKEGLEKNVIFLGDRSDIPELLKITDIFVFPSLYEGFSLVTLEVIASSTPIIATDVGSIREIVTHNKNGLIIPPRDSEAISENILTLLDNPLLSKSMATTGNIDLMARFSIDQTTKKLEEIYM
ncbi:glycosyltransferase [Peribacillus sp. NPDC096622]|uniref:glycosyltransferase n=1 Tax=Peribacillus sp. NPDC096622 TaxID=3364396 RepID=UPI00382F5F8F